MLHVILALLGVACRAQSCAGDGFDLTVLQNGGAGYLAQSFDFPPPIVMVAFCEPLTGTGCKANTAVCLDDTYSLGANVFTIDAGGGSVEIKYTGGDTVNCISPHTTSVTINCDAQTTDLYLFMISSDECETLISGMHCAACAAGCPGGPPPSPPTPPSPPSPPPGPAPGPASVSPTTSASRSMTPRSASVSPSPASRSVSPSHTPPVSPSRPATAPPPTPPPPTPPPPTPPRTPPPPDAIDTPGAPNVHTTTIVSVIMGVLGCVALSIIVACLMWMYKGGRRGTMAVPGEEEDKSGAPLVPHTAQSTVVRHSRSRSRSRSRRRYDSDGSGSSSGEARGRSRSRRDRRSRSAGPDGRSRSVVAASSRRYDEAGRLLPKHWRMERDPESGRCYYYHTRTRVRTVTRPADYEDSTAIVSRLYSAV